MGIKNYWTTFDDEVLADFALEFHGNLSISRIFEIIEAVYLLANRLEICKIDSEDTSHKYIDSLKSSLEYEGFIAPYYLSGYKYYSNEFKYPFTKLFFFEGNKIVEKNVSELCNVNYRASYITLEKIYERNQFKYFNFDPKYSEMIPPVKLIMSNVRKDEKTNFWSIGGSLNSDIWLENVSNLKLPCEENYMKQIEISDNREIASLNAPRMNSFLKGLKDIADSFGGDWFLEFEKSIEEQIKNSIVGSENILLFPIKGEILYY